MVFFFFRPFRLFRDYSELPRGAEGVEEPEEEGIDGDEEGAECEPEMHDGVLAHEEEPDGDDHGDKQEPKVLALHFESFLQEDVGNGKGEDEGWNLPTQGAFFAKDDELQHGWNGEFYAIILL